MQVKEGEEVVLENICEYLLVYAWTISGKICRQMVTDLSIGNPRGVEVWKTFKVLIFMPFEF